MRRFQIRALPFALVASVAFGTTTTAQVSSPRSQAPVEWTLDDVLAAALAQPPLVEAARARLTAAQGARQTAGVYPNPVATYWVENAAFPGQSAPMGLARESSIYGTFPLEPFLQRGSRIAQAENEIRAAEASVTTTERAMASEAVHGFYRVALAQASLEAVRDNLGAIDQLVVYLRNRVGQGATPEGELIRAEVERNRVETDVTLAEVELVRAQSALRPLLGGAAAAAGNFRVSPPAWTPAGATLAPLAEFLTQALARRSELVASRARADSASSAVKVERSLTVRQLGASFGAKRTAGVTGMIAGVSLTVPLFDRNDGQIQRATGEQLAAALESRWLERTIASEVEAEYQVAERLAARVMALQPSFLSRAEDVRRIALGAYQEGAVGLLQVLDASRALSDARLAYARLLAAANESLFDLGVAAGYDPRTAARLGRGLPPDARSPGGAR